MDNAPIAEHRDNITMAARLPAIEKRLDEVIKSLDQMKAIFTTLDCVLLDCQRTVDD